MPDCTICKPDPLPELTPEELEFITPVRLGGTRHRSSCPTLPHLSPEDERRLRADLAEMDRVRRRAEVECRNIFIG